MSKTLHSSAHRQLLDLLVQARREAALTQQELAARLGRHQSFIAKVENGERRIDVVEFVILARALEQDPITLFERFLEKAEFD